MSRSIFNMSHRLVIHGQSEIDQAQGIGVNHRNVVKAFHPIYDQFAPSPETRESIRSRLGLRKRVLLFFGFIRPYKGLDCLLDAFCALAPQYPDVSLLIVGEQFNGKQENVNKNNLLNRHLSLNDPVRSQIVWIDRYVANEEVSSFFTVADALVAPYLSVTQSGPLQIAYAFGKPVIASDLPAFRECISAGESGYLFSVGNAGDLAEKIVLFLEKPLASEQIRLFRQRFSWDRYVDLLFDSHDDHISDETVSLIGKSII